MKELGDYLECSTVWVSAPSPSFLLCPGQSLPSHSKIIPLHQNCPSSWALLAASCHGSKASHYFNSLKLHKEFLVSCIHLIRGIYPLEEDAWSRQFSLMLEFQAIAAQRELFWGGEGTHCPHIQILMHPEASHVSHSLGPSLGRRPGSLLLGRALFPGLVGLTALFSPSGWAEPLPALPEAC